MTKSLKKKSSKWLEKQSKKRFEEISKSLANLVKNYLLRKKMTSYEFAIKVNMPIQRVRKILKGTLQSSNIMDLAKIESQIDGLNDMYKREILTEKLTK